MSATRPPEWDSRPIPPDARVIKGPEDDPLWVEHDGHIYLAADNQLVGPSMTPAEYEDFEAFAATQTVVITPMNRAARRAAKRRRR